VLNCPEGRTAPGKWIDFNFYGNQLVSHFATSEYKPATKMIGGIPVPNLAIYLSDKETC
jgi:extradiol dioxygenase family protein